MSYIEKRDLEALDGSEVDRPVTIYEGTSEEIRRARELQTSKKILRKLRRGEEWLDEKMGIESQGIDRVLEEKKLPPSTLNVPGQTAEYTTCVAKLTDS